MSSPSTDPTATAATNQVLTFVIGEATYGIDIPCVQEIRGWSPVTRLPQAPADVLGVLNLRGAIVPVLDLRLQVRQRQRTVLTDHRNHRGVGDVRQGPA